MKKIIISGLPLIVTAIMLTGCYSTNLSAQPVSSGPVTYQTFYDNLSPYGTWIDYPGYGNVWSPRVDGDFRPYATNGNWIYSNEGWAWESNYEWGWAPFHYGRWLYDDMYGWLWIPGYDWSPAWVTWGTVDDYYCWAPLMPEVSVSGEFSSWRPHAFYWNVCSRDHIYDHDIWNRIERPEMVNGIFGRINIINNFDRTHRNNLFYSKGPDRDEVARFTNRKIDQVSFREVNKMNHMQQNGRVVNVYRPAIQVPQPREVRRVDNSQTRPIRTIDQKPTMQRTEQRNNIDRLPVIRNSGGQNHNGQGNNQGNKQSNNKGGGRKN